MTVDRMGRGGYVWACPHRCTLEGIHATADRGRFARTVDLLMPGVLSWESAKFRDVCSS